MNTKCLSVSEALSYSSLLYAALGFDVWTTDCSVECIPHKGSATQLCLVSAGDDSTAVWTAITWRNEDATWKYITTIEEMHQEIIKAVQNDC